MLCLNADDLEPLQYLVEFIILFFFLFVVVLMVRVCVERDKLLRMRVNGAWTAGSMLHWVCLTPCSWEGHGRSCHYFFFVPAAAFLFAHSVYKHAELLYVLCNCCCNERCFFFFFLLRFHLYWIMNSRYKGSSYGLLRKKVLQLKNTFVLFSRVKIGVITIPGKMPSPTKLTKKLERWQC